MLSRCLCYCFCLCCLVSINKIYEACLFPIFPESNSKRDPPFLPHISKWILITPKMSILQRRKLILLEKSGKMSSPLFFNSWFIFLRNWGIVEGMEKTLLICWSDFGTNKEGLLENKNASFVDFFYMLSSTFIYLPSSLLQHPVSGRRLYVA